MSCNERAFRIAGSLLLLDEDEIYNALLLFAPDGRMWRYDRHYPCAWERAYFRENDRITVARTIFKKIRVDLRD